MTLRHLVTSQQAAWLPEKQAYERQSTTTYIQPYTLRSAWRTEPAHWPSNWFRVAWCVAKQEEEWGGWSWLFVAKLSQYTREVGVFGRWRDWDFVCWTTEMEGATRCYNRLEFSAQSNQTSAVADMILSCWLRFGVLWFGKANFRNVFGVTFCPPLDFIYFTIHCFLHYAHIWFGFRLFFSRTDEAATQIGVLK